MNIHAISRSLAAATSLLAVPVMAAEKFGPLELSGFAKEEYSSCDNCSPGLLNPSPYDPRGVLFNTSTGPNPVPLPKLNQASAFNGHVGSNLGLIQLTARLSHEFDNAVSIEAVGSGRERNGAEDIPGRYVVDAYLGVAHPRRGALRIGTMTSRSWSRSDSFAYPLGLSNSWALSGAGYGVFPKAIRYSSRLFEVPLGKLALEASYAMSGKQDPINYATLKVGNPFEIEPPRPKLVELFAQFSNQKNLVELIFQTARGGVQSSFGQSPFVGSQGNTESPATTPGYRTPTQDVLILQGTYYRDEHWRLSYGARRSEWSGLQQQCDFGTFNPVPATGPKQGCFYDQGGWNYAQDGGMHHAIEYDQMLGVAYLRKLWVFTAGAVQMDRAFTHSPTEFGQSNRATFVNVGVYRKVPELSQYMEIYGGAARVMFWRPGPAPLSMPGNLAFFGADPRVVKWANGFTIGANFVF